MNANWSHPTPAINIKPIPWLSEKAIEFLDSILDKDMYVCEFGGGGSTLWMAKRVAGVTTIENKEDWAAAILKHAPYNVAVYSDLLDFGGDYDLLFIDGEPVEKRGWYLENSPKIVKPGGWVVLDNANRPEYIAQRESMKNIADLKYSIQSPGGRYFLTEFWKLK